MTNEMTFAVYGGPDGGQENSLSADQLAAAVALAATVINAVMLYQQDTII